jgi:hypothetical protein
VIPRDLRENVDVKNGTEKHDFEPFARRSSEIYTEPERAQEDSSPVFEERLPAELIA